MEILVGKIPETKDSSIMSERDGLIKIIRNNGFNCHEFVPDENIVNYQNSLRNKADINNLSMYLSNIYFWPRDMFLYLKNKKIIMKYQYEKFHIGEGGSSVSSPIDENNLFLSEYLFSNQFPIQNEKLSGINIFNITNGKKEFGKKLKHVDLTCFYSGEHETLFIDQNFYSKDSMKCFENIKNKGINVVFFNEEKHISYNYYPANCLSVPKNNINETVFINEASIDLRNILENNYGIDTIKVKMYKSPQFQGSIRCASNIFESSKPKEFIAKLNEINLDVFKILSKKEPGIKNY